MKKILARLFGITPLTFSYSLSKEQTLALLSGANVELTDHGIPVVISRKIKIRTTTTKTKTTKPRATPRLKTPRYTNRGKYTCATCKQKGHTQKTCKKAPVLSDVMPTGERTSPQTVRSRKTGRRKLNRSRIKRMVTQGWTDEMVAIEMGANEDTIANIRSGELGLKKNTRKSGIASLLS